jgi:hypothetical protein
MENSHFTSHFTSFLEKRFSNKDDFALLGTLGKNLNTFMVFASGDGMLLTSYKLRLGCC